MLFTGFQSPNITFGTSVLHRSSMSGFGTTSSIMMLPNKGTQGSFRRSFIGFGAASSISTSSMDESSSTKHRLSSDSLFSTPNFLSSNKKGTIKRSASQILTDNDNDEDDKERIQEEMQQQTMEISFFNNTSTRLNKRIKFEYD